MRRLAPLLALLPAALPAPAHAARPAGVALVDCRPSPVLEQRSATWEARMRAVGRSERLQVRFTLQLRAENAGSWRRVAAPGLDEWRSSLPGVRRYAYAKTVQNLTAPASYRALVRFRWLDGAGRTLRTARATAASCRQPDLRPDLEPRRVEVVPGRDGAARYVVTLRNAGPVAAGPFTVGLLAGAADLVPATLAGLSAGGTDTVALDGPACAAGEELVVTADAGAAVDERAEDDNVLRLPCP